MQKKSHNDSTEGQRGWVICPLTPVLHCQDLLLGLNPSMCGQPCVQAGWAPMVPGGVLIPRGRKTDVWGRKLSVCKATAH